MGKWVCLWHTGCISLKRGGKALGVRQWGAGAGRPGHSELGVRSEMRMQRELTYSTRGGNHNHGHVLTL